MSGKKFITPGRIYDYITEKCHQFSVKGSFSPIVVFSRDGKSILGHAMIDYYGSKGFDERVTMIMYSCSVHEQVTVSIDFTIGVMTIRHKDETKDYFCRDPRIIQIVGIVADVISVFL